MNKIYKSKRGFTLLEVVIVIAIIVLLAAVVGLSVSRYMKTATSGSSRIHSEVSAMTSNNAVVNSKFAGLG